jgi:hypothetical protein
VVVGGMVGTAGAGRGCCGEVSAGPRRSTPGLRQWFAVMTVVVVGCLGSVRVVVMLGWLTEGDVVVRS